MTYDQALSPRLGQRPAPERPGVPLVLSTELPEAPYTGLLVFVLDQAKIAIYDGTAWVYEAAAAVTAATTVIATSAPLAPTLGLNWYNPTTSVLKVWNGTSFVEVHDSGINTALANAATALANANTAQSTATTALALASAPIPSNAITSIELAAGAITSKHTLTNPTIVSATFTGGQTFTTANIGTVALQSPNTWVTMPEIRPTECYLRNVPVSTGGSAIFMGSTGRLFQHTSAKKYKKNIKDLATSHQTILALRPVSYDMRKNVLDDAAETDGRGEIGFIADEAAELGLETLVGRGDDGAVETFHYYKLPILQQIVLREQQTRINQLEERLTALEGALTEPGD